MFPPVSFRIQTQWSFTARIAEVADILAAPENFPRWWPEVYLAVTTIERGDARGIGQTVDVHSRGWLPYHLHWQGSLVGSDRLLFRILAHMLRQVIVSNHNWAMAKGEFGLRAELGWRSSAVSPG